MAGDPPPPLKFFHSLLTNGEKRSIIYSRCGYSLVVKPQLPKLMLRVRFPSPAPKRGSPHGEPLFGRRPPSAPVCAQMTEWRFRDIRWYTNAGAHTPPEDQSACTLGVGRGCIRHRRNTRRGAIDGAEWRPFFVGAGDPNAPRFVCKRHNGGCRISKGTQTRVRTPHPTKTGEKGLAKKTAENSQTVLRHGKIRAIMELT